jgi:pilus assembly protein CpaD
LLGALLGLSAALGACTWQSTEVVTTASVPVDYRHRHPIAVTESDQSIVVFVGRGRGGLSGPQRADVAGMAYNWMREGTGAIIAEVPIETANARAAAASYQEIRSVLMAGGVPSRAITLRHYHPDDSRTLPTIRLSYPKIAAVAGPCGLWPQDLGPAYYNREYLENRPYWNFGCATQRNLAAMVDNPADLAQPRAETPALAQRRTLVLEKYRKGESPATHYPNQTEGKISDVGK